MLCSNCGFQLEDGDVFCPNCGTKKEVSGLTKANLPQYGQRKFSNKREKPSRNIRKVLSGVHASLSLGTTAIKNKQIRNLESFAYIIPLLIFIEGLAVMIYGVASFAMAGGFSEELKNLKEAGLLSADRVINDGADKAIFFHGLPVIILNVLLITAIICFAIEFFKGKPSKVAKAAFIAPITLGIVLPMILVLIDKIQRTAGASGLCQSLCNAANKHIPEGYVKMVPELMWKNMFFFGFIIALLGCLVLLTSKSNRTIAHYLIMPLVMYFIVFPFLLFIIENALAFGAIAGTLLLIVGGLILFLLIVSILDEPGETIDDALKHLGAAKDHEDKANSYGLAGRMLGFAADERQAAASERAKAMSILRKYQ